MNIQDKLVETTIKRLIEYNANDIQRFNDLPKPTAKRNFEGFNTTTCGTDMSDFIPENEYHQYSIEKWRPYGICGNDDGWNYDDAYIAEITPEEYIRLCFKYIYKQEFISMQKTLDSSVAVLSDNVYKYAEQMKNGTKFDLPYIDFRKESQEGRHRALAAWLNGYKTMPCLILI